MNQAKILEIKKAKPLGGNEYKWLFFVSLSDRENDLAYFSNDQKQHDFIYSLKVGDTVEYEIVQGKKKGEYIKRMVKLHSDKDNNFKDADAVLPAIRDRDAITEKDRFIAKQAVFKGMCEVSKRGTPIDEVIQNTKRVIKELF